MTLFYRNYWLLIIFVSLSACDNAGMPSENAGGALSSVPAVNYSVTQVYTHDTTLFTEGLVFYDGKLYESSGAPPELPFTRSVAGISDLVSGTFLPKVEIDKSKYFGEGIAFFGDRLYQLTYTNRVGFVYDARTFKELEKFSYANKEGWGLTTDGRNMIMSDGTENLTYFDPRTLQPVKVLPVTENGMRRDSLNELEYINGYIYANVWTQPYIVKIDTASGKVVGKLDLSAIVNEVKFRKLNAEVLNGIAYDSLTRKVYVTGKLWPDIYEIDFQK